MSIDISRLLPHFTESMIRMLLLFFLLKSKEKNHLMQCILFIFLVPVDTVFTEIITTIKSFDDFSAFILLIGRFFLAEYFFAGFHFERLTKVVLVDMVKLLAFVLLQSSILERIFFLVAGLAVSCIFKKIEKKCRKEDWFFGAMLLLGSFMCINISSRVLLVLLILIFDLSIFYKMLKLIREKEDNNKLNAFIEKMNSEVSKVLENDSSNQELRALRHEIRNEYIPVREMLANGDFEGALKLFDELSEDWERSLLSYKTVNSGNKMIDSVFNYFIRKYSGEEFDTDYIVERCSIAPSLEKEICQIQINLLKNAFEAAEKTNDKKVQVAMFSEKNYLKIRIVNSVLGSVGDAIKNVQSEITTKSDIENHGFGIPSVKTKLRLLHGYFMCFEEDGLFGCEMGIPLKMDSWEEN